MLTPRHDFQMQGLELLVNQKLQDSKELACQQSSRVDGLPHSYCRVATLRDPMSGKSLEDHLRKGTPRDLSRRWHEFINPVTDWSGQGIEPYYSAKGCSKSGLSKARLAIQTSTCWNLALQMLQVLDTTSCIKTIHSARNSALRSLRN
jgi:hypothetical protein